MVNEMLAQMRRFTSGTHYNATSHCRSSPSSAPGICEVSQIRQLFMATASKLMQCRFDAFVQFVELAQIRRAGKPTVILAGQIRPMACQDPDDFDDTPAVTVTTQRKYGRATAPWECHTVDEVLAPVLFDGADAPTKER
jgi:hypothetical protein